MTSWIQIFLDTPADSFEEAVDFWAAVTGWTPSERRGEDGQFLTLVPAAGSSYVKMQAVDGAGGVHLDLDSDDRAAAIDRARTLGATTAWTYHDVEVMRSPGGFVFCQTLLDGEPVLHRDGATILDQVCLDIPADLWDREVAFWKDLTGRGPQVGAAPEFVRLVDWERPRILLQRLGETGGTVRAHPDLATADRDGDAARHVELGADVVRRTTQWTVLRDPAGVTYCVTVRRPGAL
jgi:hypothetical protein